MPRIDIDIRVFRRYAREIEFTLNLEGRSFPAKTVDYSFNSLGVIIEEAVTVDQGDIVDLDIDALGIHQKGKVVRVNRQAHSTRVGIARLGRLNGSFRDYNLSDLLIGFQRTLKAGILEVRRGASQKKLYIRNGNLIFSTSNLKEDRIGDILLREGRLTPQQYEYAAERKNKTDKRYAVILVEAGLLKPSELLPVVELQAIRIIESLFAIQDAEFEFVEGPFSSEPPVALRLSVADLIYREVRKSADTELLKKYLLDSIIDFSSTPLNLFQNVNLESADRTLISYINGKATIRELISLSSLEEKDCLRSFYALLEARIIETRDSGEDPLGIPPQEVSDSSEQVYSDLIERIDEMYSQCHELDYYRLLGVDQRASADEIKKAYFKAARKFHPDMHLDLPGDMKEKLVDIFSRINNAYLTLKDYGKRVSYNDSLGAGTTGAGGGTENSTGFTLTRSEHEDGPSHPEASGFASVNAEVAVARYLEGKICFRKEKNEDAAHNFASAIYFDSSKPEYHYFYGYALEKLGKLKEAMQELNRAYEMAPNNADVLAEIGHVYLRLACPLRAMGNFERALRLDSSHERAKQGMEMIKEQNSKANPI